MRMAARIAERLSAGRLDERMVVRARTTSARLATSFNQMASNLQRRSGSWRSSPGAARFVSDVSHELRTPLTTVRMAADVLHESREDFDPPSSRSAELLQTQLDRFEALLADLLEISRFDAGAAVLDAEPVDLRDIVAAVATPLSRWPSARAARWRRDARRPRASPRSTRAGSSGSCATWSSTRSSTARARVEVRVAADDGTPSRSPSATTASGSSRARPHWSSTGSGGPTRPGPQHRRHRARPAIALEDARLHGGWLQA